MKDYMFLFRGGSDARQASPQDMQSQMSKWFAWIDTLKSKGYYVAGHPLTPAGKTVRGSKMIITDGAYAEGKEIVGGYFLVRADSLDHATELAKDCPDYPLEGSVEP